jgi:hypothetical protein
MDDVTSSRFDPNQVTTSSSSKPFCSFFSA